jgi:uncharacterized phiE125 gp8 family phage protein
MAGVIVTTAPTQEPLTLQEVKDYLRLADAIDERVLQDLVEASRQFAEEYMARSLMTQTLTLTIDAVANVEDPLWEGWKTGADLNSYKNYITLIKAPVQSVSSVKTYNDSDVATTMAASKYYVDSARDQARVVLRTGETFPPALRVANAIEVVYVAGYTSQSAVPATIRIGLMQHAAYLYEQRGDMGDFQQARELPPSIKMLYAPYVIHSGMGSSSLLALG